MGAGPRARGASSCRRTDLAEACPLGGQGGRRRCRLRHPQLPTDGTRPAHRGQDDQPRRPHALLHHAMGDRGLAAGTQPATPCTESMASLATRASTCSMARSRSGLAWSPRCSLASRCSQRRPASPDLIPDRRSRRMRVMPRLTPPTNAPRRRAVRGRRRLPHRAGAVGLAGRLGEPVGADDRDPARVRLLRAALPDRRARLRGHPRGHERGRGRPARDPRPRAARRRIPLPGLLGGQDAEPGRRHRRQEGRPLVGDPPAADDEAPAATSSSRTSTGSSRARPASVAATSA